jgi:hypothetical protein
MKRFRWERGSLKTADPKADDGKTLEVEVQNRSEICSLVYNGGPRRHGQGNERLAREKKAGTLTSTNQMKAC